MRGLWLMMHPPAEKQTNRPAAAPAAVRDGNIIRRPATEAQRSKHLIASCAGPGVDAEKAARTLRAFGIIPE